MTNDKPYIVVDDSYEPSAEELMLDTDVDLEYTTPYTDNYDDILDVGGTFEVGGIFDDR